MVRQRRLTRITVNLIDQGTARTQSPTTKNYTPEVSTFWIIARVSPGTPGKMYFKSDNWMFSKYCFIFSYEI